jgi:inosine-uridine nucleoside N-ribohydrolase
MRDILIDTDGGVDDALAITLALVSPELNVTAITTVAGNIPVDIATRNVFTIMDAVSPPTRPPVAQGAAAPLSRPLVTASEVHGADGLGNITTLRRPDVSLKYPSTDISLSEMSAVDMILQEVEKRGKDLTIVTIGPLTNVAQAILANPDVMRRVGQIVIMGGAFRSYGNITPAAEFNIYVDPEAAAIVTDLDVPKVFVPLDVTEQVAMMRSDVESRYAANPTRLMEFVRDVSSFYMDFHKENDGFDGCYMHDPTTVAAVIDPSLVTTVSAEVHVECDGKYTAGMTVADLRPERQGRYSANVEVCTGIDAGRCMAMMYTRFGGS